jgi:hypothetical protein
VSRHDVFSHVETTVRLYNQCSTECAVLVLFPSPSLKCDGRSHASEGVPSGLFEV